MLLPYSFSEKGENEKTTWSPIGGISLLFAFARYLIVSYHFITTLGNKFCREAFRPRISLTLFILEEPIKLQLRRYRYKRERVCW
jgi:hypothetical protein